MAAKNEATAGLTCVEEKKLEVNPFSPESWRLGTACSPLGGAPDKQKSSI